jgi:hypothetical protein
LVPVIRTYIFFSFHSIYLFFMKKFLSHKHCASHDVSHKEKSRHAGFVILFAVIISAMITLLGAGIFTVAFKETVLSSTASESQIALFAADSGMECTLYHEFIEAPGDPDLWCAGDTILLPSSTGVTDYEFRFPMQGSPSCGYVTITRDVPREVPDPAFPGSTITQLGTEVVSRGYNVCLDENPDMQSRFLVERRLKVWFTSGGAVVPPPPPGGGGVGPIVIDADATSIDLTSGGGGGGSVTTKP